MAKNSFENDLKKYLPFIEAIVELFHPYVEAAVHDLKSGKVAAIYHNISRRKVGDTTPIRELNVDAGRFPDHFKPYYKRNWDGRQLKCTSITIRDVNGEATGLVCFNFDTSMFASMREQLGQFLAVAGEAENPVEMYGENWQQQVTDIINEYAQENKLSLERMTRKQKKELVQSLYKKGIFNYKNAPTHVAMLLKVSRATVYNYLQEEK